MADIEWLGRAGAVAEVDTITIAGTWAQDDTVTITINGKDLVITIGTLVTTAQVATTVKEAFEGETLTDTAASVVPAGGGPAFTEHSELTATVSGSVVTLTADTAGVPWNVNSGMSVSNTGVGTATLANASAATGPNFADNADNWSTGAVPGAGDDVWLTNSAVSILYGLDQISGTLSSFNQDASYTGDVGLPKTNASGYPEFRLQYLAIDASAVNVGRGDGSGSGRIKIDSGTVQTAVVVESTGSSPEIGLGAFIWKGTNTANTVRVQGGSVSIAPFNGETANVDDPTIAAGDVDFGGGVTFTAGAVFQIQSGSASIRSTIDTITNTGGTVTILQSAAITTLNCQGGTTIYKSSGTITTATVGGPRGAILDFSQDNSSRTATNATLKAGGTILDPLGTVTYTNGLTLDSDVQQVSAS